MADDTKLDDYDGKNICECGHLKETHSSVDTICYGSSDCKCGRSYPLKRKSVLYKVNWSDKK